MAATGFPSRQYRAINVSDFPNDEPCERCGDPADVVQVSRRINSGTWSTRLTLCGSCLALLLEIATGIGVTDQLDQWRRFAEYAATYRKDMNPSPRAIKRRSERHQVQQNRKAQPFS